MAAQPDILVAYEQEKVPTSAVMELNRVHLYFKHQFSQVQRALKERHYLRFKPILLLLLLLFLLVFIAHFFILTSLDSLNSGI